RQSSRGRWCRSSPAYQVTTSRFFVLIVLLFLEQLQLVLKLFDRRLQGPDPIGPREPAVPPFGRGTGLRLRTGSTGGFLRQRGGGRLCSGLFQLVFEPSLEVRAGAEFILEGLAQGLHLLLEIGARTELRLHVLRDLLLHHLELLEDLGFGSDR